MRGSLLVAAVIVCGCAVVPKSALLAYTDNSPVRGLSYSTQVQAFTFQMDADTANATRLMLGVQRSVYHGAVSWQIMFGPRMIAVDEAYSWDCEVSISRLDDPLVIKLGIRSGLRVANGASVSSSFAGLGVSF